ncbi:MAG: hypothetical protein HYX20_02000 [Candidatus Yanofskybacteria bacterium]|nr:hypothetical protein [Candidatus Yanofskybacteria bacterium]
MTLITEMRKDAEKDITTITNNYANDAGAHKAAVKYVGQILSDDPGAIVRFSVKNNEDGQRARLSRISNGYGFSHVSGDFHFEKDPLFKDLL